MSEPLWVPGTPRAKGSYTPMPKRGGGTYFKGSDKVVAWQQLVSAHAAAWWRREPSAGPVTVRCIFCFARPKAHFRIGRFAHLLKDNAPKRHVQPPDVDKLLRNLMDGLTGVCYLDDAQVYEVYGDKRWVDLEDEAGPGARVWVKVNDTKEEK